MRVSCLILRLSTYCIAGPSRKVRPRPSAWYYLCVEATRRNLILPDLPAEDVPVGHLNLECGRQYYT
jgi:hypothetical protein